MTGGQKVFRFLSVAFFGLIMLSDPTPHLLFLALVPMLIGFVLLERWLVGRASRSLVDQPEHDVDQVTANIASLRQDHLRTMIRVTMVWIGSGIVMAYAMFVLKLGLGDDWMPFVREQTIMKGDPLAGYALMDMPFFIAGFLFVTGFAWLPMYYFFEGMEARRKVSALAKGGATHA